MWCGERGRCCTGRNCLRSCWVTPTIRAWARVRRVLRCGGQTPRGRLLFNSSRYLFQGVFLLDPYLAPMLAALSPAVWAVHAPRGLGTIVYTLGRPVRGIRGEIAEPLQLLSPADMPRSRSVPTLSGGAGEAAITWWTRHLNGLFGVLTDPAVFTDTAGVYNPTKHLQGLLGTEQLFRRVHSMLIAQRDSSAQRTLMFAALDALTAVTGRDLVYHCGLKAVQQAVQRVRATMSTAAAEVLLPAADSALDALRALQNGFFLGRDPAAGTHVTLTYADGGTHRLDIELATAQYLAAICNATHGFTARKGTLP
jgi:hypothetical protein